MDSFDDPNSHEIFQAFREAITRFLVPLQTTRSIDHRAFADLVQKGDQIAQHLKKAECIPKSILNEFYVSIRIILAEAQYRKDEELKTLERMAADLEFLFGLILKGESKADRKPGVPRII